MNDMHIKLKILAVLIGSVLCTSCHRQYPEVTFVTELGEITMEVYTDRAPVTSENFLRLCQKGVYNQAAFYRVVTPGNQPQNTVKIEVIQGGLFHDSVIVQYPVIVHETTDETGIRHLDGTVSMARNEPGSASTEFFICIGDQPSLDFGGERNPDGMGFAAFGRVVKGMDVVEKIQQLPDSEQYLNRQVQIRKTRIKGYL